MAMETKERDNDRFLVGQVRNAGGEAHAELCFDFAGGRQELCDIVDAAIENDLWAGTGVTLAKVHQQNAIPGLVVHRLPFGPHWPVSVRAFVFADTPDMQGIDAAGSEALWNDLRRRGILRDDGTPDPAFLLQAPMPPLVLEGWSEAQCAFVRNRTFAHMRPLGYAELLPDGGLKIAADRFVLTQIAGGLRRGMGGHPILNTGERLRLMPDVRFCFDKGARGDDCRTVAQLDLTGFYTGVNEAIDFLERHLESEAAGFEGVIVDV